MLLVRDYLGVKAWGADAQLAMQEASRQAARTLEDLADIINFHSRRSGPAEV
jgi:cell pole-organizing protein PopZ